MFNFIAIKTGTKDEILKNHWRFERKTQQPCIKNSKIVFWRLKKITKINVKLETKI